MTENESIVWHKSFGIGKVISVKSMNKDNLIGVQFDDDNKKTFVESFADLIEMPANVIKYILNDIYASSISENTLNKAKQLVSVQKVQNVTFLESPFSITAEICDGDNNYNPKLEYYNNIIVASCTCENGHDCEHDAALMLQLKNILKKLNTNEINYNDDNVKVLTKDFFASSNIIVRKKEIKAIVDEIVNTYDEEKFAAYIKSISENYANKKKMPELIEALSYNAVTRNYMREAFNTIKSTKCYSVLNLASRYINSVDNDNISSKVKYYYYNDYEEELLKAILLYAGLTNDEIVNELSEKIVYSEELFNYLIKNLKFSHNESTLDSLMRNLDEEKLLRVYMEPDYPYAVPEIITSNIPIDNIIDGILKKGDYLTVSAIKRVLDECKDEKILVACLHKVYVLSHNKNLDNLIIKKIDNMPDNSYLKLLFTKNYSATPLYLTIKPDRNAISENKKKELYRYFGIDVKVDERYGEDKLVYLLYSYSSNEPIIKLVGDKDTAYIQKYELNQNPVEILKTSSSFLYDMTENFRDEIQKLMEEKEARKQQEILEAKKRKLLYNIKAISSFSNMKIALSNSMKADVDFYFYTKSSSWHDNLDFSMSMKIGITKKYSVKDTLEFLRYFEEGRTVKYGKELEFTHTLENIAEDKKKAIKLLMLLASGYTEKAREKKYLPLSSAALYDIIESLKGSSLYFNDVKYDVVLDEIPFSMGINSKYEITYSNQGAKNRYFVSNNEIVVFDEEEHRIDVIKGNTEQIILYDFALENRGLSIEPCLEEFKQDVLAQYYPYINIDESIRSKMTISELTINAYFDYSDKVITVSTSLERDGKKLDQGYLENNNDKIRYNTYLLYLSAMGFENNVLGDDAKILNFFSMDMTELKRYCNVYLSDSIQNKKLYSFANQSVKISYESGIMSAFLDRSEYSDEELDMILKAIKRKKNFVLLSGNRIVDISGNEAKEFEITVRDLGLDQKKLSEKSEISIQQALKGFAHESNCRIDEYLFNMVSDIKNFKKLDSQVPNVNAELRPYQIEAYKWLSTLSKYHVGGILADDMGLGKTLEIITKIVSDKDNKPNLVVCPKSLVFNWVNEFNKFAPNEKVVEIYGNPSARKTVISSISQDEKITYVTSYDSLRNDMEYYDVVFNNLILDEAQYIKNVTAQKSISVKQIKAVHKMALTGTPIENNIIDLWSIFDFVMPGYFEELSDFKSYYSHDSEFTKIVSKRIAPFVLRRTKGDVLKDLPDKYERIVSVEMLPEQRKVYDAYKKRARDMIEEGAGAFDILPYLMRLRQICDDPSLFAEDYKGPSAKVDALMELVDQYINNDHKILIFSQFVKGLERIEKELNEKGIDYYKITGDTPSKERIDRADKFNASNDVKVFLISLKAGGTGLNLTGADTVIHLDPWWNVAAENQASDRAHRIGQTKNVEVIKLICENSVEQRVIELQNIKKDLIDKLISNTDESVTGVTLEDISFILN